MAGFTTGHPCIYRPYTFASGTFGTGLGRAPPPPPPLGGEGRGLRGAEARRLALARLSPNQLFAEAVEAVLSPMTRSLGLIFVSQLEGAVMGSPLPLGQSLLIAWPQAVGLIAATIVLFVVGYVAFQRQEVRA